MPDSGAGVSGSMAVWAARVRRLRAEVAGIARSAGWPCAARFAGNLLLHLPLVLRTRGFTPVDRAMGSSPRRFRVEGHDVWIPSSQFGHAREICGRRAYFHGPDMQLAPGRCVVDLGANGGVFTVVAAQVALRVLAVEALPQFAEQVRILCRRNGCGDRVAVEVGVVGGVTGMFAGSGHLEYQGETSERTSVLELGALLQKHSMTRVDFMKVDIEGAEFGLFAGPPPWLGSVDRIAMEVHPEFGGCAKLAAMLRDAGFLVEQVDLSGRPVAALDRERGYFFCRRPARAGEGS